MAEDKIPAPHGVVTGVPSLGMVQLRSFGRIDDHPAVQLIGQLVCESSWIEYQLDRALAALEEAAHPPTANWRSSGPDKKLAELGEVLEKDPATRPLTVTAAEIVGPLSTHILERNRVVHDVWYEEVDADLARLETSRKGGPTAFKPVTLDDLTRILDEARKVGASMQALARNTLNAIGKD